jgi:hypothetical protein
VPRPFDFLYAPALTSTSATIARRVALIAAMHKLVAAIYSVAKHRRLFVAKLPSSAVIDP